VQARLFLVVLLVMVLDQYAQARLFFLVVVVVLDQWSTTFP